MERPSISFRCESQVSPADSLGMTAACTNAITEDQADDQEFQGLGSLVPVHHTAYNEGRSAWSAHTFFPGYASPLLNSSDEGFSARRKSLDPVNNTGSCASSLHSEQFEDEGVLQKTTLVLPGVRNLRNQKPECWSGQCISHQSFEIPDGNQLIEPVYLGNPIHHNQNVRAKINNIYQKQTNRMGRRSSVPAVLTRNESPSGFSGKHLGSMKHSRASMYNLLKDEGSRARKKQRKQDSRNMLKNLSSLSFLLQETRSKKPFRAVGGVSDRLNESSSKHSSEQGRFFSPSDQSPSAGSCGTPAVDSTDPFDDSPPDMNACNSGRSSQVTTSGRVSTLSIGEFKTPCQQYGEPAENSPLRILPFRDRPVWRETDSTPPSTPSPIGASMISTPTTAKTKRKVSGVLPAADQKTSPPNNLEAGSVPADPLDSQRLRDSLPASLPASRERLPASQDSLPASRERLPASRERLPAQRLSRPFRGRMLTRLLTRLLRSRERLWKKTRDNLLVIRTVFAQVVSWLAHDGALSSASGSHAESFNVSALQDRARRDLLVGCDGEPANLFMEPDSKQAATPSLTKRGWFVLKATLESLVEMAEQPDEENALFRRLRDHVESAASLTNALSVLNDLFLFTRRFPLNAFFEEELRVRIPPVSSFHFAVFYRKVQTLLCRMGRDRPSEAQAEEFGETASSEWTMDEARLYRRTATSSLDNGEYAASPQADRIAKSLNLRRMAHSFLHAFYGLHVYRLDCFEKFYAIGPELGAGGEGHVRICMPKQVVDCFGVHPLDVDWCECRRRPRRASIPSDDVATTSFNPRDYAYAVKIVPRAHKRSDSNIYTMAQLLCKLRHPNVLHHHAFYEGDRNSYLVMNLADGPELLAYLVSLGNSVSPPTCRELLRQILQALEYIHSQNIIHRDVKLENFVCAEAVKSDALFPRIQLIDFGVACGTRDVPHTAPTGTPMYMAPELFIGNRTAPYCYDCKVDVWGAGVIFCQALTGRTPFDEKGPAPLIERVSHADFFGHADNCIIVETLLEDDVFDKEFENLLGVETPSSSRSSAFSECGLQSDWAAKQSKKERPVFSAVSGRRRMLTSLFGHGCLRLAQAESGLKHSRSMPTLARTSMGRNRIGEESGTCKLVNEQKRARSQSVYLSNAHFSKEFFRLRFDMDGEEWNNVSEHAKDMVRLLLTLDPQKRPTASEALKHPFFS